MIEAVSEVETTPNSARRPFPRCPTCASGSERELVAEFLVDSHYVPLDGRGVEGGQGRACRGQRPTCGPTCGQICRHVFRNFAYKPRSTGVATLATDAIKLRSGVCQDFAHVALGMCRCSGIPARYVSGYFMRSQRKHDDDEASHAWIEAYVPGYGWAAFDPTHDRPADERYVKVASGRDYADIRPVSGTYRGGKTRSLNVEVKVREAEAAGAVALGLLLLDRGHPAARVEDDADAVAHLGREAVIIGDAAVEVAGRPIP